MNSPKRKWYYGWTIVFFATFITLFTAGMRMSIGPFFMPLLSDFNMTRTDLSIIVAVGMLVYGVGMPLAGYMESRIGPRIVLLIGAIIVFGSSLWMIFSSSGLHLMLSFGVFLSIGLALTSQITLTPIIVRWFIRRRGQALFYLSTGSMAGIAVMNPVSNVLIELYSWQHAIAIFAVTFTLLIVLVALFVIREDVPEGADLLPGERVGKQDSTKSPTNPRFEEQPIISLKESVRTLPFWQICIGLFACGYSMNLLGSHGVPMLIDHGFSSGVASSAVGFIGLVAIPGTLMLGSLADRVKRRKLLALIYITRGVGFVFIVLAVSVFQLYLVALIAGLAWAGNVALSSAILTDVYGVRLVGILYGLAFFVHQIGATISTLLGGWAYEKFHTHLLSFGSAAFFLLIAGLVSLKIPERLKSKKTEQKQTA